LEKAGEPGAVTVCWSGPVTFLRNRGGQRAQHERPDCHKEDTPMKRLAAVLVGASFVVWTAGCSQPPTAEIDAATAKVQAAGAEGATYAPDAYKAAQDAIAQLDAEVEAQNQKFAVTRSYARVSELAAAAGAAADRLQQAVNTEKERLRAEASRTAADAKSALGNATASLDKIPASDADAIKADVAAAEKSLSEIDALLAAGQLKEAQEKATAARQSVTQIGSVIEEAEAAAKAEAERRSPDRTVVPRAVLADGTRLAAGTYRLRVTSEEGPAVNKQPPATTGRWVEFLRNGKVAGRALAVVLTAEEAREIAKSPAPGSDEVRIELLKGDEYVRVWLNQRGTHYLIHLPIA
jgi:hypothetical protein